MNKQREFIKNYDTIIKFAKDAYFSGKFSNNAQKISSANFYKLKKNIEFIVKDKVENSHFKFDDLELSYNIFLELYQMKSFTKKDIFISFAVMLILNGETVPLPSTVICEKISCFSDESEIEQRTLERKLKELHENGYINCTKKGNQKLYYAKENIFSEFSSETLLAIAEMTEFHINTTPPSLCGFYLLETIKRTLRTKYDIEYQSIFLIKHLHLGQIFHDETVWNLIELIENCCLINITLNSGSVSEHILPYKIIVDESSGRRYLFAVSFYDNTKTATIFRIDKIRFVTKSDLDFDITQQQAEEIFENELCHSFTGSCLKKTDLRHIALLYPSESENIILMNFPDASLSEYNEKYKKADIWLNNVSEIKPWLRKFIGKFILAEGDDNICEQMENELAEWRELYGTDK